METIVAAAIAFQVSDELAWQTFNDKRTYPDLLIVSAPPPARHHTLLHMWHDIVGLPAVDRVQGFITSTGRFVDREEAYDIAVAAGQDFVDRPSRIEGTLFSEDLW